MTTSKKVLLEAITELLEDESIILKSYGCDIATGIEETTNSSDEPERTFESTNEVDIRIEIHLVKGKIG